MKMIRKIALLLGIIMMLGVVPALASGVDMYVDYCDEWVSLRESPSTSSDRICKVPKGEMVFGYYREGDFRYCEYNGRFGYILEKYLVEMEFDSVFGDYDPSDYVVNDGPDVATEGDTIFGEYVSGDSTVSDAYASAVDAFWSIMGSPSSGSNSASAPKDVQGYTYPTESRIGNSEYVGDFYVKDSEVEMYGTASLSGTHVGYLHKGDKVAAYSYSENFYYCYEVGGRGQCGYMSKSALKKTGGDLLDDFSLAGLIESAIGWLW